MTRTSQTYIIVTVVICGTMVNISVRTEKGEPMAKCLECIHWKPCFNGKDWDATIATPCEYFTTEPERPNGRWIYHECVSSHTAEELASHLNAHGVTMQPVKIGDTVYGQFDWYGKEIHECKIVKVKVCQFRDKSFHCFLDVEFVFLANQHTAAVQTVRHNIFFENCGRLQFRDHDA
jgi:hypothetical protein